VAFIVLAVASMVTSVLNQRKINKRLEAAEAAAAPESAEGHLAPEDDRF
jgi:hypothetical protein